MNTYDKWQSLVNESHGRYPYSYEEYMIDENTNSENEKFVSDLLSAGVGLFFVIVIALLIF